MVDFGGSFFFSLVSKECSGSKLLGAVEFEIFVRNVQFLVGSCSTELKVAEKHLCVPEFTAVVAQIDFFPKTNFNFSVNFRKSANAPNFGGP